MLRGVLAIALTILLAGCESKPAPTSQAQATPGAADASLPSEQVGSGPAAPEPPAAESTSARPEAIDVHIHLVGGHVEELLEHLDRHRIAAAAVLASPHLDPDHLPPPGEDTFSRWREANERLLAQTEEHRDRLLPFITVEPAQVESSELAGWIDRGACGVKLYIGHHSLHARPLGDPAHAATFELLEQRGVPVLLHVNTVRYEDELDDLLRAYPKLSLVCPHLCGSRTDLDRLERLLRKHPSLRVDTSHGEGKAGVKGFTNIERGRERLEALIHAQPERFLYGSDLVTLVSAGAPDDPLRYRWDGQLEANLGLVASETFEFLREGAGPAMMATGEYRGLALKGEVLEAVLAANARSWLKGCLQPPTAAPGTTPAAAE